MESKEYTLLTIFGDGKIHSYSEAIISYRVLFKEDKTFKVTFKKFLEYYLLYRGYKSPKLELDSFQLSRKGDEALRNEAVRRGGDFGYYHYHAPRELN